MTTRNEMTDRERAVQIVNQLTVKREELGRECSQAEFDEERLAFRAGCSELAQIADPDVQLVLAKLLTDRQTRNLGGCAAWRRLVSQG